jgi:hypothetical protein
MPDLIPPSITLVPAQTELRHRLAVALREVDLLRRLIRVADHAARYGQPDHTDNPATGRQGVTCGR